LLFHRDDPNQIIETHPLVSLASSKGDSFSAVELRRIKAELPAPPEKYTVKPAKTIPPQPLPGSIYEIHEDLPTQHEGTQPSNDPMQKSSKSGKPRMTNSF
jgi:hypothetical protein